MSDFILLSDTEIADKVLLVPILAFEVVTLCKSSHLNNDASSVECKQSHALRVPIIKQKANKDVNSNVYIHSCQTFSTAVFYYYKLNICLTRWVLQQRR